MTQLACTDPNHVRGIKGGFSIAQCNFAFFSGQRTHFIQINPAVAHCSPIFEYCCPVRDCLPP
jgi:hypothetical protein